MLFANELDLVDFLGDAGGYLAWCAVAGVAVIGIACYAVLVATKKPPGDAGDEVH